MPIFNRLKITRAWKIALWAFVPMILYGVYRAIPPMEVMAVFQRLTRESLFWLLMLNMLILILFSTRWWIVLRTLQETPGFLPLVGYRLAGFAVSYFTPGTQFGGEPLQAMLLNQRQHIKPSTAIASVTLDKLFELLFNFSFLVSGVILMFQQGIWQPMTRGSTLILGGGLLALPFIYLVSLRKGFHPLSWTFSHLPEKESLLRIQHTLAAIEEQCARFMQAQPLLLLAIAAVSTLSWLAMILEYWLMAEFLGIHLNVVEMIMALTAARLAFLTPLPGALGALEASQAYAMQILGLDPLAGLSLGLLIRARDVALGCIGLGLGAQWSSAPLRGSLLLLLKRQ